MLHCKLRCFFIFCFRSWQVLTSKICYITIFSTATPKIWRLLGWWGAESLWNLEKYIMRNWVLKMALHYHSLSQHFHGSAKKYFPHLSLTEKLHAMIQRKLSLTLAMSLPMFYKTMHHLLQHLLQQQLISLCSRLGFFLSVFAYCQLTLEPDFLLIYVLQMNFA